MAEQYLAEVIESSTTELTAQCRRLHESPDFGSFVKVGAALTVIAQVYEIITGSVDVNRRPVAYGKTEEQLREEQPQIFELLRTEFKAKIVGYSMQGVMRQLLPPQPPKLHSFVYACALEEVYEFTKKFDYFRTLTGIGGAISDELLIAAIQQTCCAQPHTARQCVISAGKELSRLLRDDYDRLESILRRIAL